MIVVAIVSTCSATISTNPSNPVSREVYRSVRAFAYWAQLARAPCLWTQLLHPDAAVTVLRSHLDANCQAKWDPDETYDRAVTVVASRRDCQSTVHCSEDYQTRSWFQAL